MSAYRFTKEHEWIDVDGEIGTIGITEFAQQQMGDVVFVQLPEVGKILKKGEEAAVVESVKAASEIYAPVSGEVVAVNGDLEATPATVNEDATGKGWFFKIKIAAPAELDGLMTKSQYQDLVAASA
jgi:glycine cleavage system H protein